MIGYIEWRRPVGRHRGRWLEAVYRDAKGMSEMQELEKVGRRWRRRIEEAKAQVGL